MKINLNVDYIIDQYVNYNRSAAEIAREFNCNEKTISVKLRKAGISTKRRIKQDLKQDLTKMISGRLIVIKFDGYNKSGDYIWLCQCKCGNKVKELARSLLRKDSPVKSCGCARRNNSNWESVPPWIISIFKVRAQNRDIDFNLSLEYCDKLFRDQNQCCAISGVTLNFGRRRNTVETTASLDRIDSNQDYEEGNVQWVHKRINIMKNNLSDQEFIKWCKAIAEYNK